LVPQEKDKIDRYFVFSVFIFVSILIALGGYLFYGQERSRTLFQQKSVLYAISNLKVQQMKTWNKEKNSYAEIIMAGSANINYIRNYLADRFDKSLEKLIIERLESYRVFGNFKGVLLFDPQGNRILESGATKHPIDQGLRLKIKECAKKSEIQFLDIYAEQETGKLHMGFLVPLKYRVTKKEEVVAVVLFDEEPDLFLFPLIQTWPIPSASSETLLVRKEGGEIVFVNELRHKKNTALKLRYPLERTDIPAVRAVLGKETYFEGADYRGVRVVSVLRKVEGTPWFLVAKTDIEELEKPLKKRLFEITFGIIGFILLFGAGLSFYWLQQKNNWLKRMYEYEAKQKAITKHFEFITKYANDVILLADENLNIVFANEKASEIYGYSVEEFMQLKVTDLRSEFRTEFPVREIKETFKEGLTVELVHKKKDGALFTIEGSGRIIDIEGKIYYQTIIRDITERKKYEANMKKNEEKYRALFENANDAIFLVDADTGIIVDANKHAEILLGRNRDELIGLNRALIHPKEEFDFYEAQFKSHGKKGSVIEEGVVVKKDGSRVFVQISASLIDVEGKKLLQGVFHDITKRKVIEKEKEQLMTRLSQGEKMSAVGQVAAGVAHEINNPMTSILGFTQILLRGHKEGDPEFDMLRMVETSALRCKDIVSQLLTFSNSKNSGVAAVDVNILLDKVLALTNSYFKISNIYVTKEYTKDLVPALASQQLDQVFMSILTNARDAMPEGGELLIKTRKDKNKVIVEFKDTGTGVSKEDLKKLFTPFYTTKSAGRGTGLGLAIVKKILDEMNGEIKIESEIKKGATVIISLPVKTAN